MYEGWIKSIELPKVNTNDDTYIQVHTHGYGVYVTVRSVNSKGEPVSILFFPEQTDILSESLPGLLKEAKAADKALDEANKAKS